MAFMDSITGSAPTPPNPIATGAAQTGTNVATGVANAYLSHVNQYTPQGNLEYSNGPSYSWTDPTSNVTYQVPTFNATQSYPGIDPAAEGEIGWRNEASKFNLANLGKDQSYQLWQKLQDPNSNFNNPLNGAPGAADPNSLNVGDARTSFADVGGPQRELGNTGQQQTTFDQTGMPISNQFGNVGDQTYGFGGAGDVTHNYGPGDFSADRNHVEDALMERMAPQLERDRSRLEQRLADQGIRYGSPAYDDAMRQLNQQQTDARFAAVSQAGDEQKRMMDMAAQRAGFQNAAQQQEFTQAAQRGTFQNQAQQTAFAQAQARGQFANAAELQAYQEAKGRGDFANEAQGQNFAQELGRGTFKNTAQQQEYQQTANRAQFANAGVAQNQAQAQAKYGAQNATRAQYLQEQYGQRNQMINTLTSLMSGSQISQPNYVTNPSTNIPTTDYAGLINNNFNQQMGIYSQNSQNVNQLLGGIFGAAAGVTKGAGIVSDRREKENIEEMGSVFAFNDNDEPKKLPIYEFSYKADPASTRHIGPMAQDVEKIDPRAVGTTRGGVKYIDTTRMGSILRPVGMRKAA